MDINKVKTQEPKEKQRSEEERGYCTSIGRTGEAIFASIVRQRSGMSAGEIEGITRSIEHLSKAAQQEAVDAAYVIYLTYVDQSGFLIIVKRPPRIEGEQP